MSESNFLGVFGHVNVDFIMDVPKLPQPNSSIEVSNVRRFFGGTGSNIAMIASSLGVGTSLASFVGTDFPADFRAALQKAGVDITDLVEVADFLTPTCRILTDPEQAQIGIIDQGPMAFMDDFEIARHTVENSQIIHVGTGRPGYYRKVMELARELNKPVYFDPAQEIHYVHDASSFCELLALSDALFVNRGELAPALRYLGKEDEHAILEHVDTLIITLGKDGSRILHHGEELTIPAIEPSVVLDPTGAGDAYRAGFYAGLSRNVDLEKCGLLGASASSFIIEAEGPVGRLPGWEEVLARAEDY